MPTMPYVIQKTANGERSYDLYSRLLEDRIILLNEEINDTTAGIVTGELLYLASKDPTADISLYINSPGGSVSAGLAILDTMNFIKPDVSTICVGIAASMGAVLLSAGAKGKRHALPHSEIMIHQPLGGMQGQASDMEIAMKHMARTKDTLLHILAENCNQPIEKITTDCDRDNWLPADAAVNYGIIDSVIVHSN